MHHYIECGLPDVWLVNGYQSLSTPYGDGVTVENVEDLHRAIAVHLVERAGPLTGAEFRFLRVELDLSQARLAAYFGNDAQSVALWEKRGKIPAWADRFLRAIYRERMDGAAHIEDIVAKLNGQAEAPPPRRMFEETADGWRAAA